MSVFRVVLACTPRRWARFRACCVRRAQFLPMEAQMRVLDVALVPSRLLLECRRAMIALADARSRRLAKHCVRRAHPVALRMAHRLAMLCARPACKARLVLALI
jgi:hypothetical protein